MLMPFYESIDPQLVVRIFDEPEAHLHPAAQRRVAQALETLKNQGADVIIASHSPTFLNLPGWAVLRVIDGQVEPVRGLDAPARTLVAQDLGVTRGELLAGISALLVVEGDHDLLVLNELFGPDLRAAGVAVARMFGTERVLNVLELDFILRYVQVPPIVMFDYTRGKRVQQRRAKTQEEKKAVELLEAAEQRGLSCKVIPLRMPDIVCYLSEHTIREDVPDFAGWNNVYTRFKAAAKETDGQRPRFRPWLRREYGVALEHEHQIRAVLDRMRGAGLTCGGDLHRQINQLLAEVTA